ncbi:MAG: MAPEG family protein [Pseudomonadota bacterium]
MSGELYWVIMSAGLMLVLWVPYAAKNVTLVGLDRGMREMPDETVLPAWARRCRRAHMNLIENFAPFAALVLVLHVAGKADPSTATAAAVFFFARMLHAIVYIADIPYVRTLAFAVGWLVCFYLLWQALTA